MIFKFQLGGTYVPPLVSYQPVTVTGSGRSAAPAAVASSGESSDLTDKDLLKMMDKLDGLPSDMAALTLTLLNFYIDQLYSPFPSTSNIASRYLSALLQMRIANFNKKEYDNAFDIIKANGGINELAVDERGYLFCMNKEQDFKLLRPEDLKNNEGYSPLTNSELLQLRAYSPELAYNQNILGIVLNGIGMESINKMIMDIVKGLKSNSTTLEGYVTAPAGKILGGIRELSNAVALASVLGIDFNGTALDLYSYKIINKDLKSLIESAMAYIYNTLPENAKTILKTKTLGGSNKEMYQLIEALISSQVDSTLDFSMKLEAGKTKEKATKASTDKDTSLKLNPAALLQAGYGLKETFTIQTAAGGSNGLQVDTVRLPIVSKEGKSMGVGTLDSVANSGFAGYLDFENATMGGVRIDPLGFLNIVVNGTSLYVGKLPVDLEEYATTGNIRPDIDALGRYKQAQNKIKKENITDPNQINQIYLEFKLPIMYGPNGDVLSNNYVEFGILNGTALQLAFSEDAEFADYLQETTDEYTIKNMLAIIQKGRGKKERIDFNEKGWWNGMWDSYDHVYKGTIFIPVNTDYFSGAVGFGDFPTADEAATIEALQLAMLREKAAVSNYVNPGMI